jgi:hypothetical protein
MCVANGANQNPVFDSSPRLVSSMWEARTPSRPFRAAASASALWIPLLCPYLPPDGLPTLSPLIPGPCSRRPLSPNHCLTPDFDPARAWPSPAPAEYALDECLQSFNARPWPWNAASTHFKSFPAAQTTFFLQNHNAIITTCRLHSLSGNRNRNMRISGNIGLPGFARGTCRTSRVPTQRLWRTHPVQHLPVAKWFRVGGSGVRERRQMSNLGEDRSEPAAEATAALVRSAWMVVGVSVLKKRHWPRR